MSDQNGYIFPAENVAALRACLEAHLTKDDAAIARMRTAALDTAARLTVNVAADYLLACAQHAMQLTTVKPTVPWQATR